MWSWSAQGKVNPIPVVKAEGIYFWDADGKRYIDFNSQLMCSNIGHGHPKVIQAIKEQVEELAYAGPAMATRPRAEIGPILARHTPGDLKKFFFTLGGAEANENAIKLAKFYTGRHKIISRYRSYHGSTHAAIMVTGDPRRWANEVGGMAGVVRISDAYKYRSLLFDETRDNDKTFSDKLLAQLEEAIIFENPNSIAGIIVEPIVGTNGILIPPDGYLQGIRKLCDKYGIIMIADEVMTGLGRTGKWFAVDHWKVVPDLMVMAKGLTSAYLPLGAVAVSAKIYENFSEKIYFSGLTYQSHPMLLAAAVANLKVLEEEDIIGNSARMGDVLSLLLSQMMLKHICVGDVRSKGLFGVLELVKNRKTKEPIAPYGYGLTSEPMIKLGAALKEKGLFHYTYQHLLHTNPPLCINETQLREAFAIIDQGLSIVDAYCDKNQ